jgi:DNA primase
MGSSPAAKRQPDPIQPELRAKILTSLAEHCRLKADAGPHDFDRRYLEGRGISFATAVNAGVGTVRDYDVLTRWLLKRWPAEELRRCGVFNRNGNLVLWGHRLLLPFWLDGECLGLAARKIDWKPGDRFPKELTVADPLVPFNADVLLDSPPEVFVCEGVIDCLTLMARGFPAVGVPGAQRFRAEWVRLFDGVSEVIVAFDNDDAGRAGSMRVARAFAKDGRTVKALQLPEGVKDLTDYFRG